MGNMFAPMGDVSPDTAAAETELEKISSKTTALVDKPFRCANAVLTELWSTPEEETIQVC